MPPETTYWFRAKRYGWGWGLPTSWQGWVVYVLFLVLIAAGGFILPPAQQMVGYLVYVAVLSAALTGICWLKGEPPKWRWGERK